MFSSEMWSNAQTAKQVSPASPGLNNPWTAGDGTDLHPEEDRTALG